MDVILTCQQHQQKKKMLFVGPKTQQSFLVDITLKEQEFLDFGVFCPESNKKEERLSKTVRYPH